MRRCLSFGLLFLAATFQSSAQQVNQASQLDVLKQSYAKQELALLGQYGKALEGIMVDLKKKGDLDTFLTVQSEKKRFETEKTVPAPKERGDTAI